MEGLVRHPGVPLRVAQSGRYRQHHQVGVEVLGSADADLDVEVIALADRFYRALGLATYGLRVNSMGDDVCRPAYLELLADYLAGRVEDLCPEHRGRAAEHPLRVLDCKRDACLAVTADAPSLADYLCEPCREHLARVLSGLDALGVGYKVDHRLVRGFDYYTRTTFEFWCDALGPSQNGIGGGGRYDGMVEMLGGPPTPGIGFGLGIERILMACDAEGVFPVDPRPLDAFVVDTTGGTAARDLTAALRDAGLSADRAFDDRSMKAQFKAADRSGARWVLVVGPDEAASGTVSLRALRGDGDQVTVPVDDAVDAVRTATRGDAPTPPTP